MRQPDNFINFCTCEQVLVHTFWPMKQNQKSRSSVEFGSTSSLYLSGMQMCFRALHDLPAGEEITQSYFPLHIAYQERQKRLQEDYGFTCTCPRCKVWASRFIQ